MSTDDYLLAGAKRHFWAWGSHEEITKLVVKYKKDLYEMKNDSPFHMEVQKVVQQLCEEPVPPHLVGFNTRCSCKTLGDFVDKSMYPYCIDFAANATCAINRYHEAKILFNKYIKEQQEKYDAYMKEMEENRRIAKEMLEKKQKEQEELEKKKIIEEAKRRIELENEEKRKQFENELFEANVKAAIETMKMEQLDKLEKFFSV
jgi:hypothetical protein